MRKRNTRRKKIHKNKYEASSLDSDRFIAQAELDFHTYENLLPYDIEKMIDEFVEDSFVANLKNVLIITGKGKVVRPLARKHLARNKYVKSFRQAGYFNGQEGAIEVSLKENL